MSVLEKVTQFWKAKKSTQAESGDTDIEPKRRPGDGQSSGDMKSGRGAETKEKRHKKTKHTSYETKRTGGQESADTKWGIRYMWGRDKQPWVFTALTKVCTCVCACTWFTATALNRHRSYQPMIQFPRQPILFFICRQTCLSETCLSAKTKSDKEEQMKNTESNNQRAKLLDM